MKLLRGSVVWGKQLIFIHNVVRFSNTSKLEIARPVIVRHRELLEIRA